MGAERRSMVISDKEKRTTAVHEAGHALVARLRSAREADPVHKVTIIPRGRALGVDPAAAARRSPQHDARVRAEPDRDPAWAAASPRRSSSARRPPAPATTSSAPPSSPARWSCEWGMSEEFGPLNFGKASRRSSSAATSRSSSDYSEDTAQRDRRRDPAHRHRRSTSAPRKILTEHREELEHDRRGAARARDASTARTSTTLADAAASIERPPDRRAPRRTPRGRRVETEKRPSCSRRPAAAEPEKA